MLITGGSGFIGRSVISLWLADPSNEVVAFARSKEAKKEIERAAHGHLDKLSFISHQDEILNNLEYKNSPPEIVLHLATLYLKNPTSQDLAQMRVANIGVGMNMARIAEKIDANFVYTSSYLEYEDVIDSGVLEYVNMKRLFSQEIRSFGELNIVENVIADTYGPGDTRRKLMSLIIESAVKNKEFKPSKPQQLMSLTHSIDVAKGIVGSFHESRNRFLCATKKLISIGDLTKFVYQVKANGIVEQLNYFDHTRNLKNDWTNIQYLQGWEPRIDLREGITELLQEARRI